MKIRQGFVSNSSSSSFIVAFPKEPKNLDELKEMLFVEGQNDYPNPYPDHVSDKELFWPVDMVASIVLNDINENGQASKKDLVESLSCGWFGYYDDLPGHVDTYRNTHNDKGCDKKWKTLLKEADGVGGYQTEEGRILYQKFYDSVDKENKKRATAIVKRFMEENEGLVFYVFEYSDSDGSLFCSMEHGTLFRRVKHIKTSYH